MECFAPAKINLSLRVLGKRDDGFHEIETLMAPISLADRLEIEPAESEGIAFTCSDPALSDPDSNLAVRAARAFLDRTKKRSGLNIHLEKRVPHGAGLGGGSSDAAAVLLALNRIFEAGLDSSQLVALAAGLGSDIAFFLFECAARCRGRGEEVTPAAGMPSLDLVLLKPPFGVPTPWAYKQWQTAREIPGFSYDRQTFPWGDLVNDLERPVFEKHLFLGVLKQWLIAQPESLGALMSGSGSACFAVVANEAAGQILADRARKEFGETLWTNVCRTIGGSGNCQC